MSAVGVTAGLLAGAIATQLLHASRRADAGMDRESGDAVARYSTVSRAFSIGSVFGGLALSFVALKAATNPFVGTAISFAIMTMVLAMVFEFCCVRLIWNETRLTAFSPWRPVRRMNWKDIRFVRFSSALGWFVLRDEQGTVTRVHMLLSGVSRLAWDLRRCVQPPLELEANRAVVDWQRRFRKS